MLKIKVIIPNAGMSASTLKDRERMLKTVAREDTEISVDCIEAGPESIESDYDIFIASSYILKMVKAAAEAGFGAVILYCGCDPALGAAREIVDIPVVGPGEVSFHLASILSHKFTIIGTHKRLEDFGVDRSRLSSLRSLDIPVIDLRDDKGVTKEAKAAVLQEGKKAIMEDGAQAIVLGCLGLAGIANDIQEKLGVPVIDPAFVAINIAELLIHLNLTHSKFSWPKLLNKRYYTKGGA